MRRVALFLALGIVLGSLESALLAALGVRAFGAGLLLGLILYLGVRAGPVEGAFASAGIGYLWDVFAGTPSGLSVGIGVVVFLFVRYATQAVDAVPAVVVVVAGLAETVRFAVLALVFWASSSLEAATTSVILLGHGVEIALATALAPLVYSLAGFLDRLVVGAPTEGGEVWLS
ncbi:MAG: hypothetical protein P1V51_24785 [Deltaproteobacteria bacterium]|nr:hypothetical protein [Deltaproteobacteria bacterium]